MHFRVMIRCGADLVADSVQIRALAIKHGFGHEVDVQFADVGREWYCAKNASKSAEDRVTVPWLDRRTGEITVGNPRIRVWTASRGWGLTMKQLRSIQAEYIRRRATEGGGKAGAALATPGLSPSRPIGALFGSAVPDACSNLGGVS